MKKIGFGARERFKLALGVFSFSSVPPLTWHSAVNRKLSCSAVIRAILRSQSCQDGRFVHKWAFCINCFLQRIIKHGFVMIADTCHLKMLTATQLIFCEELRDLWFEKVLKTGKMTPPFSWKQTNEQKKKLLCCHCDDAVRAVCCRKRAYLESSLRFLFSSYNVQVKRKINVNFIFIAHQNNRSWPKCFAVQARTCIKRKVK